MMIKKETRYSPLVSNKVNRYNALPKFALMLLGIVLAINSGQSYAQDTNMAPTAHAGVDRRVEEGQAKVRFESISGADLIYKWRQISGLTVPISRDDNPLFPFFFIAPDKILEKQTLVFGLVVTDQEGRDSEEDTVVFTIRTLTPGVVADAGLDRTVTAGDTVTLDASGSTGGRVTFYSWLGGGVTFPTVTSGGNTETFEAVNESDEDIVLSFTLTFGIDIDTVRITVRPRSAPANMPPVANAVEAQNAFVGATVTLDGSGSRDDEDDALDLTYDWTQITPSGSNIALNTNRDGATSIRPTFVVPADVEVGAELIFSLTVTDSRGLLSISTAEVTITITAAKSTKNGHLMAENQS